VKVNKAKEDIVFEKAQRLNSWNSRKWFYEFKKDYQRKWTVKRGEVYFVDLGENVGSEQNKPRPCVVIQADAYNNSAATFICAIISDSGKIIPDIHIPIIGTYNYSDVNGNNKKLGGAIDLGHIRTLAKERILSKICTLNVELAELNRKLFNTLGLSPTIKKMEREIISLRGKVEYLKSTGNKS
jgi:mRNA interferase MazF